jgi:hypothetical protein
MLLGRSSDKLRLDPRKAWHRGPDRWYYGVSFVLEQPQPAFLMLPASGMSPVYTIATLSPSIAGPDPLLRQGRTGDRLPEASLGHLGHR